MELCDVLNLPMVLISADFDDDTFRKVIWKGDEYGTNQQRI